MNTWWRGREKNTPHINKYQNVTWKTHKVKVKKQTFHQMWFFVLWFFICVFSHNQNPCMVFADTLRKLLNSNGGASEPNIQKHICPELSTCNNSPQVEVKMVGKRQVILFVENQTKVQHVKHTFSGRFFCCKGDFCVSPSGSPTNRLGKTDPTWRIGKGKMKLFDQHQWRAGSGYGELFEA